MAGFWHRTAVYWGLSEPREEMSDAPAEEFSASPVDAHIAAQVAAVQSGPAAYSAPVTREFALNVPAVLRGRNIICAIATLPLQHYLAAENKVVRSPLLEQIDPDVTNLVTLAQTVEDLIFDALSWWQVLAFDAQGFPVSARHLEPGRVSLDPPHARAAQSLPSGVDVRSVVWVDGKAVPKSSMIRFDSPNPPLLVAGRRAIRRAALLDTTAAMFAEHPRPLEYYTPQDDADPDLDEVRQTLLDIKMARQTGAIAYIGAGLERHEAGSTSPADLQLVQLQARASLDIANALGLDPEDLGVSTTSRSYANITDRRRDRINDTLAPYMLAITSRLSMNDVTRRGYAARFDLSDYLKADPATRASVQAIYLDKGVVDPAEVRADEGLPPREIEPPAALEPPAAPAEPPAAAAASRRDVIPMHRDRDLPIAATFSAALAPEADPTAAPGRVTFNVPAARAGFKVDLEKRTIVGLAVPYGEVTSDWRAIQFRAGSIARMGSPEPVLLSHDGMPVGVVSSTTDADGGMSASLRISKTSTGDDALVLADDGAITGLSVGVDVHKYELDTDTDVMTVTEATLREISLTPFPAFDSARITKVQMTQQQEGSPAMKCTICGHEHAAGTPCTVTASVTTPQAPAPAPAEPSTTQVFTAPPVNVTVQMPETFAADVATALGEARAFVDPDRRPTGAAFVSEPLPYRFGGAPAEHDFSTDVFAAARSRDPEAQTRLNKFMEAWSSQAFAVATTDVDELNPTRQRPDLWVDQKDYVTPIWDSVVKGTIPDATPFALPKFNSASGLVADHTQGSEPTYGSYTTTGQTITPAPISGGVEINREVMDQGGNPQISVILWNQIQRNYREALESKIAATLNGLSAGLTTITITTAAADSALVSAVRSAFGALQFVRGGFRFRDLKVQVDLYTALLNAKDTQNRPFFAARGQMNTDGSADSLWAALDVNGLMAVPAWALGATSANSSKSWLYDRNDVHGWATRRSAWTSSTRSRAS
ncbi:MAG: phage portal protein [Kineosporiaceae bacterium]|nr:phage portal protein [Kineosporiaceae bacterium]